MSDYEDVELGLDLTRSAVPSSTKLQADIIAKSEGLPQYLDRLDSAKRPALNWRRVFQVALPLAACSVIALLVVTSPTTNTQSNTSLVASDESDWQEIMLLEDEWLLADL